MPSDDFNLPAPPGFRGLHPDLPVTVYHRNLPHWRQDGASYFVTFRLADSIPQEHIRALKRWRSVWEEAQSKTAGVPDWEELAREITRKTELCLDEGFGECVFQNADIASEMASSLLHFQDERSVTSCYAVMPNHVHVVINPLREHSLEDLLRDIKGYVSRKVNRLLGREGRLWAEESYDRIIRDEEHLFRVIQYIGRNPAKARLPAERWVRWVRPDWERLDWGFREDAG